MPLFRRRSAPARSAAPDPAAAAALLAEAQRDHDRAEDDHDHDRGTLARLEVLYSQAAADLHACASPTELNAWLGLASVRRYQKGRRPDTLDAFGRALAVNPDNGPAWDAYLDYFTYAPTASDLLAVVAGMPPDILAGRIEWLLSVAERRDRWGTMDLAEGDAFLAALPGQLRRQGHLLALGLMLSRTGLRIEREGSHVDAIAVLTEAAATGHATPAAVDRLTVHLVKAQQWDNARTLLEVALTGPIASDTMRDRLTRRAERCRRQLT